MSDCLLLPNWLMKPEYVTFATWGLVVTTLFLVVVTFCQGQAERKRWEHQATPKARFGLTSTSDHKGLELWCANLGATAFLVKALRVRPVVGKEQFPFLPEAPLVVPIGTKTHISVSIDSLNSSIHSNSDVTLYIEGPREGKDIPVTEKYFLYIDTEQQYVLEVRPGFRSNP